MNYVQYINRNHLSGTIHIRLYIEKPEQKLLLDLLNINGKSGH
jgi:hypothetical protein